jgi:hypothetical protein
LILSAKTSRDYATQIASANQLTFAETRNTLMDESRVAPLEKIHQSLDRDYRLLTYLLRHGSSDTSSGRSLENRILMIDFRLMSIWYGLTHRVSSDRARDALLEMASIVGHLANTMGERISVGAAS